MMNPMQKFKAALEVRGLQLRPDGRFCCPSHGGDSFSARAEVGSGGKLLLTCHSRGCSAAEIAAAVGLKTEDLFPEPAKRPRKNRPRKVSVDGRETSLHESREAAELAAAFGIASEARKAGWSFEQRPADFRFEYSDEAGALRFVVLRWQVPGRPSGPRKEIRVCRPVPGGWVLRGLPSKQLRPLYRLRDVMRDPSAEVCVCEGERAADAMAAAGFVCVTSEGGAGRASQTDWKPLRGRRVCIVPDSDRRGEEYAAEVSRLVAAAGASGVRVVRLTDDCPELPVKADAVEWLALRAGESLERLQARLAALVDRSSAILAASGAAASGAAAGGVPDDAESDELPKIVFGFNESAAADEVLSELAKLPDFYAGDVGLVRLLTDEGGGLRLHVLGEAGLRETISSAVVLWDDDRERQSRPPRWLIEALLARPDWPGVRKLRGIRNAPALRPDGSVISSPGYDSASGLYCEFDPHEWPAIPGNPTREDAAAALQSLAAVLADFPFASAADRSGALAAVLAIVGRDLVGGPCPGFLFDASVRGAGKSLLADVVSILATGASPPRTSWPSDEDEARKRLSSLLFKTEPPRFSLFDNCSLRIGGDSLEAVLTGEVWSDRVLGSSVIREAKIRTVFGFSGNNLRLSGDASRRVVRVRLEPSEQNPEDRRGFAVADLRSHVSERFPELHFAVLQVLAAFAAAGFPGAESIEPWGSFERFSKVVRGALVWCGFADPLDSRKQLREDSDPDLERLEPFVEALASIDPAGYGMTCDEILSLIRGEGSAAFSVVRAAVEGLCGRAVESLDSRKLAAALKQFRGRPIGGRCLDVRKSGSRRNWFLRSVAASCDEVGTSGRQGHQPAATRGNFEFVF
jgi:hypothetical protein